MNTSKSTPILTRTGISFATDNDNKNIPFSIVINSITLEIILCLIGLNIGTLVIWGLVKLLGKPFVNQNIKKEEQEKLSFLNNPTRALIILFFIFLVPVIPKDILIYPIPLTKIKLSHFMIVSTISRIPSVLYSTLLGNSLITQNFTAMLVFGAFSVLAVIGLIFNKQIYNFIDKHIIKKIENKEKQ